MEGSRPEGARQARRWQPTVLHVVTDSFTACSMVAPLADYLASRGWRSVIVCSGRSYDDAHSFIQEMRARDLDIRDMEIPRSIKPTVDARRIVDVAMLIRRLKPSLVHTHLAKGGVIGRTAAWLAGVPCVHTVYDYAFVDQKGLRRSVYRAAERCVAAFARRIMFLSENERQIGLNERVGDPSRLVAVGCGADLSLFNPANASTPEIANVKRSFGIPRDRLVVGAVARLVPRKGVDLLLKAASMLRGDVPDWHLLIVGGGPQHHQLADLAAKCGIGKRVSFSGFIDDGRMMPAIFGAMDVFCLPSRREGYGMVYAEAGAMERPAVAPNLPPINTIVADGVTGLLSRPEDVTSIAVALRSLLVDGELRTSMGKTARLHVRLNCDLRNALERTATVYEEAVSLPSVTPGSATDGRSS